MEGVVVFESQTNVAHGVICLLDIQCISLDIVWVSVIDFNWIWVGRCCVLHSISVDVSCSPIGSEVMVLWILHFPSGFCGVVLFAMLLWRMLFGEPVGRWVDGWKFEPNRWVD